MENDNINDENINKVFCKQCDKYILKTNITHHNKKQKHIKNKDKYINDIRNDIINKLMLVDIDKLENIKSLIETLKY